MPNDMLFFLSAIYEARYKTYYVNVAMVLAGGEDEARDKFRKKYGKLTECGLRNFDEATTEWVIGERKRKGMKKNSGVVEIYGFEMKRRVKNAIC